MDSHAMNVPVTASTAVDCLLWPEADGWTGACADYSPRQQFRGRQEKHGGGSADVLNCVRSREKNGSLRDTGPVATSDLGATSVSRRKRDETFRQQR
jgi:hypothetical protein